MKPYFPQKVKKLFKFQKYLVLSLSNQKVVLVDLKFFSVKILLEWCNATSPVFILGVCVREWERERERMLKNKIISLCLECICVGDRESESERDCSFLIVVGWCTALSMIERGCESQTRVDAFKLFFIFFVQPYRVEREERESVCKRERKISCCRNVALSSIWCSKLLRRKREENSLNNIRDARKKKNERERKNSLEIEKSAVVLCWVRERERLR